MLQVTFALVSGSALHYRRLKLLLTWCGTCALARRPRSAAPRPAAGTTQLPIAAVVRWSWALQGLE